MKKITFSLLALSLFFSSHSQVILTEGFDDITTLTDWTRLNVSTTVGTTNWFQGNATVFPAHLGTATNSYIGANFNATTGSGTISNWLILPVLSLKDDDVLTFYTREGTGNTYPDRLEVRVSADGAGSVAPVGPTGLGSYTTLLLEINPTLVTGVYPQTWTLQTVTISGLGMTAVDARLAFRYFVTNGGPTGTNSNYIGIDTVEVTQAALSLDEFGENTFKHFYNKDFGILTMTSSALAFDTIEIYNLLGQQVVNRNLSHTIENIDMSSLEDGIYLAKVRIEGRTQTVKILKN